MKRMVPWVVVLVVAAATFLAGVVVRNVRSRVTIDNRAWEAPRQFSPDLIPVTVYPEVMVSPAWVAENLVPGGIRLVDVRAEASYAAAHLPGAIRVAVDPSCAASGIACLHPRLGELGLSGQEQLVLYGGAEDFPALGRLYWLLEWAGFRRLRVLEGGVAAWQRRGGEMQTEIPALPPRSFTAVANADAVADLEWMRDHFGLAGIEVLDLRDEGPWMETRYQAPPHFTAGHIPYSLPYDFRGWVTEGEGPEPEASWAMLFELGPRVETHIRLNSEFVVYGRGPDDEQLGLAYLLLRRMGATVRVFPGGWAAWSQESDCPVVRIVEPAEVAAYLERARTEDLPPLLMFDVRDERSHHALRIPGSVNVPQYLLAASMEQTIAERWPDIRRDQVPLMVYCYGRLCIRSREASNFAARSGFLDVWWLRDGFADWPMERISLEGTLAQKAAQAPPDRSPGRSAPPARRDPGTE